MVAVNSLTFTIFDSSGLPSLKPLLSQGTPEDWLTLSSTRSLSIEAVKLAAQRGLLRFGTFRTRPAWFVTDSSRRVLQARRLDGDRWWPNGPKALTLAGGQASWPVGAAELGPFPRLLLVEGGPDLLAAFHFLWLAEAVAGTTAVAMLGAANSLPPEALGLFAGKRVRIVPHRDHPDKKGRRAGIEAALRWHQQLQGAGATVDLLPMEALASGREPVKDLNELCRLPIEGQATAARGLVDGI